MVPRNLDFGVRSEEVKKITILQKGHLKQEKQLRAKKEVNLSKQEELESIRTFIGLAIHQ